MHTRHGRGGCQARAAGLLAGLCAALLGLAGCSASNDSSAGRSPGPDPWMSGGQTGSLMPSCGLAPALLAEGVPASAGGFVVYATDCAGEESLGGFELTDASGRRVPISEQPLAGGAVLITPEAALPPGTYQLGVAGGVGTGAGVAGAGAVPADADGGVDGDDDAGIMAGAPFGEERVQRFTVEPPSARPAQLGELTRVGSDCSATFALQLAPETVPYAGLLSLQLRIDSGATQTFIAAGTLEVDAGRALLTLPMNVLDALGDGPHTLTLLGSLADEPAPLPPVTLPFEVDCFAAREPEAEAEAASCSIRGPAPAPHARAQLASFWLGGLALALVFASHAHRRRRRRPPD